jgi:glycerol-3-phosphate acyltransferase PlsY
MTTSYLLSFVVGYLLGSIPFGLVFTRLAGTQDILSIGSGSIGATNVLRTGRKGIAAATLLADLLKGTVAVLVAAWWFGHDAGLVAGVAAFLGHLFPVWMKFKGGKGIATGFGVLLAVSWKVALAAAVVWLAVAVACRYSSVSSLTASVVAPVLLWFFATPADALSFAIMGALTFIMHRANIARLASGTESKIGQKA